MTNVKEALCPAITSTVPSAITEYPASRTRAT